MGSVSFEICIYRFSGELWIWILEKVGSRKK